MQKITCMNGLTMTVVYDDLICNGNSIFEYVLVIILAGAQQRAAIDSQ